MEAKPTATPWIAVDGSRQDIEITTQERINNCVVPICELGLNYTGAIGDEQRANVSFIVRAVNAHHDLVEALKGALVHDLLPQHFPEWLSMARTALTKAGAA
jgi:hypothetical protein